MKKISFDFLATMPLKEIDKSPSNVAGGKSPIPGADFRLFADGSIYPSSACVFRDNLEFQNKDSGLPEFGYDVFLSTDWGQYNSPVKFPCITKVSKHADKVALFARTKYNKDGTPKSSILNLQTSQGEDLIEYLKESYLEPGEALFAHRTFVDLKINFNTPVLETANKIYNLPKKVLRGKDAGKASYVRRENIVVYPLEIIDNAPVSVQVPTSNGAVISTTPAGAVPADLATKIFG